MFLAAVREARHFGPQDPRLDISLNKLALLRVTRGRQARLHAQHPARPIARQRQMARHGRQRYQPRLARWRARPGRHIQARLSRRFGEPGRSSALRTQHFFTPARMSRRSGEHSRGARRSLLRPAYQAKRLRAALHWTRPTRRAVPSGHHERRQKSLRQRSSWRVPRLHRSQQWQRPHSTIRRAGPHHPGRRVRHGSKRQAARSPRRAMLHVGQPHLAQLWLQQRATA